ncbi:polyamine-modulated factor 1-binding protein 1-like [Leucoraja erinacea]|uniref:polyamine-modulated factor 1-binding protein 1-like n=1 Tax=Leucoraja erinaceus TaxID=7782 RepID=UPI002455697C|nr:polyamine-modulated factor 1-binding protein 1-like [Leucoraja erinacea]
MVGLTMISLFFLLELEKLRLALKEKANTLEKKDEEIQIIKKSVHDLENTLRDKELATAESCETYVKKLKAKTSELETLTEKLDESARNLKQKGKDFDSHLEEDDERMQESKTVNLLTLKNEGNPSVTS